MAEDIDDLGDLGDLGALDLDDLDGEDKKTSGRKGLDKKKAYYHGSCCNFGYWWCGLFLSWFW